MKVANIINDTAKDHSPYMGSLVNHLPMAQWAVYKLSGESDAVDKFTSKYLEDGKINRVKEEYQKVDSLEEALGKRDLYEGTLEYLKEEIHSKNIEELTREILNEYKLGMSSGLFHTLIRVAYGMEAYQEEETLKDELLRGLAYYVTAYRRAEIFDREISTENIRDEIETLSRDLHIRGIIKNNESLGQRMKELYNDYIYMKKGFVIKGSEDEKIRSLLDMLIPLYNQIGNIVILHCITGLHALIVLKDYFDDFQQALDILTTCIITHLIATGVDNYPELKENQTGFSWKCLVEKTLKSRDVHDIKLTYSALSLDEMHNYEQFKDVSFKRLRHS